MKTAQKLKAFDITRYLDSEEAIAEYLSQVLEGCDNDELIRSLGHIAKAKGMATVAKESGLGRESLYKALTVGSQPRFDTISKVINALGLKISVHA
ncbi:putative addiction module antidote protein [Polynucleobacter sphagniphilus]|uniref:addiction module antidote protein n=1 Tax=Polynucleobacter sphagniphilus TaxID=1743169 RepID=UPI00247321C0|nr:addiction module antidote protein [Polynucleobacter sphagniphilus]MDH6301244.1 putative addiction module antidote protein [Polynucleobacter sphagniphilus]